jgi:hypothetical protein
VKATIRALVLAAVLGSLALPATAAAVPRDFFGIGPQTPLTAADVSRMRAGGIGSVRVPVVWSSVQPSPQSTFRWGALDEAVELTARAHLEVLPFLYGTPHWLGRATALPADGGRPRRSWSIFLQAAAERYGPQGEFWIEHGPASADFVPKTPIRTWQIWNEPNFFYFARPASPGRYGRLLRLSSWALRQVDPGAKTISGGLFGNPRPRPPLAMKATEFLRRLYRVKGVKAALDGIALHPYVPDVDGLQREVEDLRRIAVGNGDRRAGFYLTEMGWGSAAPNRQASFEVGLRGQARELRDAYRYLIPNRHRLNLKQVYWFSWKDLRGDCNFCDSAGLFREGLKFRPKPAWHAFVRVAR